MINGTVFLADPQKTKIPPTLVTNVYFKTDYLNFIDALKLDCLCQQQTLAGVLHI